MSKHLILLPCHAIFKLSSLTPQTADSWHLAPFQTEANDHLTFIQHIEKSFQLLNSDEESSTTLVISGGMTKADAGEISEATSYLRCAEVLGLDTRKGPVLLEEYARDSFENLLFSLCLFKENYGVYPERVSIVGFEFKKQRFVNFHAKALKILEIVEYHGIDPTPEYEIDSSEYKRYFKELKEAEWKFSVSLFQEDLLGNNEKLKGKKLSRDFFDRRDGGYSNRHPDLARFFTEITNTTDDFEVPW